MEVEMDSPLTLPNLRFLNPLNLKRQRSARGEESAEKRRFLGRAYEDIIDEVFSRFGMTIFGCVAQNAMVYDFTYNGKNRYRQNDTINLFFRLKILDLPQGKKASLYFQVQDSYGPIDNRQKFAELKLSGVEAIRCGGTMSEIKSALREIVTNWLNFAEVFFS